MIKYEFFKGTIKNKDIIAPSYISTLNPKYVEIDNMYYSSILVVDYYKEYNDLILKNLINTNINMNISIIYEKQDSYKTIRDLTYHIGNVGVDLKDLNENREDVDIAVAAYNDAKYIRREMQVNSQDLYYLYIYITLFSENIKELEIQLNKIEGMLESNGIRTRRANFRQEQALKATMPSGENPLEVKNASRRNILTDSLISTYPFISSSLFDENGVFIGKNLYNNSLIFVDRYDKEKYKNANMCVFGTSGAGKSFFIKSQILRYRLLDIEQYIIDPERGATSCTLKRCA